MDVHCSKLREPLEYLKRMAEEWVSLALSDVGLLSGLLLAACRHLSLQSHRQEQYYLRPATQYKLACVQALNRAISVEGSSAISDATVAKAMVLAYDEVRHPHSQKPLQHL